MNDDLGNRIKNNYENRTRFSLPRRTYTIIRLDGKAFHTYTRHLKKPFDLDLINDLDNAVLQILPQIQGAKLAYVQSDEISILLTDFEKPNTDAWFDGNIQKIVSVSSSLITAQFNRNRVKRWMGDVLCDKGNNFDWAYFDSRVFTIPDWIEVYNYFVFRNQDCARNSISMVAHNLYSNKQLLNKNSNEKQELIYQKGINWSEYDESLKNGRLIVKEMVPNYESNFKCEVMRQKWVVKPAWVFTQNPPELQKLIPKYNQ